MNSILNQRIELFERNNEKIIKKYWLKNIRLQILSGFIYTCSGKEANIEVLDECRELLSKQFGFLSSARDNLELPIMASMAVSSSPEAYTKKLKKTYEYISKGTFLPGDFDMLAAMILMDAPEDRMVEMAEKMKEIYKKMGKNHPLLTDSSDKSSAALLTLSDKNADDIISEMEECFKTLKATIKLKDDRVQSMSALLALQDAPVEQKCAKTIELCEKLKSNKISLNMSMALPIVAGLSAIDKPVDEIIEGVKEAYSALKGRTGFGVFGLGKEGRIIYGITNYLACFGNEGAAAKSLAQTEVLNVIIQEIILMMIIISSTQVSTQKANS